MEHELPNILTILADRCSGNAMLQDLCHNEFPVFSLIIVATIAFIVILAARKAATIPGRLQSAVEMFVGGVDEFVCGVLGPKGRKFTPFIGTLFIYILFMNLSGIVPLMKSSTSSWSTTLALALCVFFYLQYTSIKELGFFGYIDHLLGRPRGILAFSVIIPLMLFCMEVLTQLVRPISLSLRLRSNIWGDDMLLTVLAGFGIKAVPLLVFNMLLAILASIVQATVFCLLTTIYFALALAHEEEKLY